MFKVSTNKTNYIEKIRILLLIKLGCLPMSDGSTSLAMAKSSWEKKKSSDVWFAKHTNKYINRVISFAQSPFPAILLQHSGRPF